MWLYWLLFMFPALAAIASRDTVKVNSRGKSRLTPGWLIFGLVLVIVIGLRHQVGGDWYNYLGHLDLTRGESLGYLLTQSDPGYKAMNWLSLALGWDIYGVNTMSAVLFTWGLVAFCRSLPRPWLAATVAIPYLVIVVAMGYSRQGIALGLAMLGLLALSRRAPSKFVVWVLAGAAFHRSAMLLLPIAALAATRKRIWIAFWIAMTAAIGYLAFLERDIETLYRNYIERGYESQGALIRLGMNAIAGGLFLGLRRRMGLTPEAESLWRWISLLSLALFAAYFVAPGSSTALDRLGLYLLPLQLVVFSHLPNAMGSGRTRKTWVAAVVAYYFLIQFVWLNFAANAYAWLPYKSVLLEPGW